MAATKRVRVARVMVTAMKVVGNKESQGHKKNNKVDDKGGVQQRG